MNNDYTLYYVEEPATVQGPELNAYLGRELNRVSNAANEIDDIKKELNSILTAAGITPDASVQTQVLSSIYALIDQQTTDFSASSINAINATIDTLSVDTLSASDAAFVHVAVSTLSATAVYADVLSASSAFITKANITTLSGSAATFNAATFNAAYITTLTATVVATPVINSLSANTTTIFQDNSGREMGQLCKAWVNFNGTGTVAIRDSFNVSSITDNGVGSYTVNLINAMSDTNYAPLATATSGTTPRCVIGAFVSTTSAIAVVTHQLGVGNLDVSQITVGLMAND